MPTKLLEPPAERATAAAVVVTGTRDEVIRVPAAALTWDGFHAWVGSDDFPERGRIAFLGGEVIIDMSPERFGTHVAIKTELSYVLYGLVRAGLPGQLYGDGIRIRHEEAGVSNEPDLMFASDDTLTAGRVTMIRGEDGQFMDLVGSPDMVLEVVSPSSVTKDYRDLRERYHAASIREYWLIDARGGDLVFDLLHHALEGYRPVTTADGWRPSAVFAREFHLDRTRDRHGDWAYTLRTRPLSGS